MTTPQPGDLWKCSAVIGVVNSSDSPHPEDWPESGNIKSNGSWHTEVMVNHWYVFTVGPNSPLRLICETGEVLELPEGRVKHGEHGWELVFRPDAPNRDEVKKINYD